MSDETVSNQARLRNLLGGGPVPLPGSMRKAFQPWHRPRKQYVRQFQWSREIGFLTRDLKLADGEFRYLTLPGQDLLDIRHIVHTICEPNRVQLRYLGFNNAIDAKDPGQASLNSEAFSIQLLESVHPESEVFRDDFRMVGELRSKSWHRMRRFRPFHAINLDLCGGFAGATSGQSIPNYFTALQALLQHQSNTTEEFLLFVTTRIDPSSIDEETGSRLSLLAQDVYLTCRDYKLSVAEVWGIGPSDLPSRLNDIMDPPEAFALGLTQWIVSRSVAVGLRASVRSFMTYRTGNSEGDDDILSLCIRFAPDPVLQVDPAGLARPLRPVSSMEDKICRQSAAVPARFSARTIVDDLLRSHADLFERCVEESGKLLAAAGYDPLLYREWVDSEQPLVS